jgi:uncharacterized protein
MNNAVREAEVQAVVPAQGARVIFLGDETKSFVIWVEEQVGNAIASFINEEAKDRPLTHDLFSHALLAFGAKVERVVINDVSGTLFFARLILSAENELGARKVVELDARPSDCLALAAAMEAPIYVAEQVWQTVDDMSDKLREVESQGISLIGGNQAAPPPVFSDEDAAALAELDELEDDADFEQDDDDEEDDDDDEDDLEDFLIDEEDEDDEEEEEDDDHRPGSSTY